VIGNFCDVTWTIIGQSDQSVSDIEFLEAVNALEGQTATQIEWIRTKMKQFAPQTLLVASS
jgi:hypothetical protein